MTTPQIRAARAILAKHGLADQKEEIVLHHTNGRTSSLTEMNYTESQSFFKAFESETTSRPTVQQAVEAESPELAASRKKLLSLCHENGWETEGGKVDYKALNKWCKKYTPSHKPFRQQTQDELSITISIYSKMYMQNLQKL